MFHKALELEFKNGTELELTFQDGKVKRYDMSLLFEKYPQLLLFLKVAYEATIFI